VSAVRAGLIKIVQGTLLGSILMNLLFVLGCCFLVAGCRTHNLEFNAHSLTYNLAMLAIGSLGLIVPTFSAALDQWSTPDERLTLSRFVSCFLMAMYVQWLVFALSTHTSLVASTPQLIPSDEVPEKTVPPVLATVMVAASTVLVAMHCEFLVHAIEPVMEELQLKEAFMSTVILPLVGNISEEIAAISIASKGKIDLAMAVAIGAATQVALFAVPVVVFIAWGIGQPMDLDFEVEQVILLIFSLVVVFMSLQDAEGNWLKGTMLITAYVIVCCSFWTMHNREFESAGAAAIGAVVQTTKQSVQT
jgi:Ca2+:H+ antiporter